MAGQLLTGDYDPAYVSRSAGPGLGEEGDLTPLDMAYDPDSNAWLSDAVGYITDKGTKTAGFMALTDIGVNPYVSSLLGIGPVSFVGLGVGLGMKGLDALSQEFTGKGISDLTYDLVGRDISIAGRDLSDWFGETFLGHDNFQNAVATSEAALGSLSGLADYSGIPGYDMFSAYDEFGNATAPNDVDPDNSYRSGFADDLLGWGPDLTDWSDYSIHSMTEDTLTTDSSITSDDGSGGDTDFDGGWSDNWGDPGDYSQNSDMSDDTSSSEE